MHLVALVLAGGSGERFWPVSTRKRPKQLLKLTPSGKTLLEDGIERARTITKEVFISTSHTLSKLIGEETLSIPYESVIAEPHKRNTAGALVWAVASIRARLKGEDCLMAVLTADHLIEPLDEFSKLAVRALAVADRVQGLVIMGVRPTRPETGYGYIEVGEHLPEGGWHVKQFKEKPDLRSAKLYLEDGGHLWNSGMFFWRTDVFERELRAASPEHGEALTQIQQMLAAGKEAEAAAVFDRLPNISIDRALMEKSSNRYVVEAVFRWDDLGSWDSIRRLMGADDDGNTLYGAVRQEDSKHVTVYNNSLHHVNLLGVENLVVVVTESRVLICHKDRVQEVRDFASED